jgi:riboflavin biosynthesis pyrimidine reductase
LLLRWLEQADRDAEGLRGEHEQREARMRYARLWLGIGIAGGFLALLPGSAAATDPAGEAKLQGSQETASPAPVVTSPAVTIQVDKASLENGGTIQVSGTAPAGKPVYIEVWSAEKVRASRFDTDLDKDTGKRPYILYMTDDMPAFYKLFVPKEQKEGLEKLELEGSRWSVSKALKDLGADAAYSAPAKGKIDRHQATLMGSIVGSRGELLARMDDKESRRRSMQLLKAKFRSPRKVFGADVEVMPDGTYKASIKMGRGLPPGSYNVAAAVDKTTRSRPAAFENKIGFPHVYLGNAGASVNLFWPFLLALAISIFGVMMGAGGGFMLNPLLVTLWPLPHTVVAGTVMPTVLFSQGSGIYNYSKIKFISWKVGVAIGLSTIAGGFLGPKLTELVTLEQYKFVFGWILIVLAALMLWQTSPGYLARNKKEQAILKEFKKRAEDAVKGEPRRAA